MKQHTHLLTPTILTESDIAHKSVDELTEVLKEKDGKDAVKKIITRIEGYANAGLEHLQTLYNTKKEMFRDPFVFVNILKDIK